MNDFIELKEKYRVRFDQFEPRKSFVSKDTFNTYEEAWEYAKKESIHFRNCGFCVIYDEIPQLDIIGDISNACR